MKRFSLTLALAATALIAGCGGGGGSSNNTVSNSTSTSATCSVDNQKTWVRAHLDDVYLWYDQIVDVPPASYTTAADYFYALLVRSEDRFSFTESQATIDAYFQSGADIGYGASFVNDNNHLRISYTDPGTPAVDANLTRGVEIVQINGSPVDLSQGLTTAQTDALYPSAAGTTTQFTVKDVGSTSTRSVSVTSQAITSTPVQNAHVITAGDGKKVGYLLFNSHIATAESELIDAMTTFQQDHIDDLVIDVRYNGGGYLYVADELASMIGGTATQGRTFETETFNAKHQDMNESAPFLTVSATDSSVALPMLNLSRVFVLTGLNTCSASESIINSLRPILGDSNVITIGGTTCGKPYGMIEADNCEQAYFAIQFKGVNDAGWGDYANGFAPTCAASDDLDHQLGDTAENLFSTALSYRTNNQCPVLGFTKSASARYAPIGAKEIWRAPWKSSRILR